jgi:tetratricopeptide (TPR) repeat protein
VQYKKPHSPPLNFLLTAGAQFSWYLFGIKKTLLLAITALALNATAQLKLPELSPEGKINQNVGYVNFEIHYGRPAARGRKIFGELVPYGQVWRTGGGANTKIQFDKSVTIGGKSVPAGTYTVVTIPNPTQWTILLNSNTQKIFGAQQDGYDLETEVARFDVPVKKTERFYESFTIEMDMVNNDAELYISWENTQVHFAILTNNNTQALKDIETHLAANPTDSDNLAYAAYYLGMNKQAPERLLGYVDRALKIKEDQWYYELKMNLLADAKRFDEARKTYQKAVDLLRKAKPNGWQEMEQRLKNIMQAWKLERVTN